MIPSTHILWENDKFAIKTPSNPHIPYIEGLHLVVAPKETFDAAWSNVDISTEVFKLASEACKIMVDLDVAPWFNIQANGNWGLLPGNSPFFHVHIYGRNKTANWGKPIVLPELPNTFENQEMPEIDRKMLIAALTRLS